MANRREFVTAGVAAAASLAPGLPAWGGSRAEAGATLALHKVVFDARYPASLAFAAEAKRLGADVLDIRGDITHAWNADLSRAWKTARAPVAGMTVFSSLLGLRMMAESANMRVIYRAHHRETAGSATRHETFGPKSARERAAALLEVDAAWARAAANIVVSWPRDAVFVSTARSNIIDADARALAHGTLISWIIAQRTDSGAGA